MDAKNITPKMGVFGNQLRAATPENQAKWAELHNVSMGRLRTWMPSKKGMIKGGKLLLAGIAIDMAFGNSLYALVENNLDPFGPGEFADEEPRFNPTAYISLVRRVDRGWMVGLGSTSPSRIKLGVEEVIETTQIVLPRYSDVDREIRNLEGGLNEKYWRKSDGTEVEADLLNRYRDTTNYYFRVEEGPLVSWHGWLNSSVARALAGC